MAPSVLETVGTHKPGSIREVRMKNFMTYSDAVVQPGPRLNVVIGANGTGKSTILNAICLGLGGDPNLLGRAHDARDYVMNGETKAEIEIDLVAEEGETPHTLRRVIDRNKGSENGNGRGASTFYINDEKVKVKAVQQLVTETYGIQIGNLCTFLPQDKVGNFSAIKPQELLLETEKTLSQEQYFYNTHMELIEAEVELSKGNDDVETLKSKLKKLQHEDEQLERAKEMEEEREQALERADLLKKKMLWLHFEALRERAVELKAKKEDTKKRYREALDQLRPLEEKRDKAAADKKETEVKYRALDDTVKRCQKEMEKQAKKHENHDDKIETLLADLGQLDSEKARLDSELKKAKERMAAYEQALSDFQDSDAIEHEWQAAYEINRATQRQYTLANRELSAIDKEVSELEGEAKHLQQKLGKLNDDKARRQESIFRQFPALGQISAYIDEARKAGKFRKAVYGPIVCEMTPQDETAAAFIEQHVSNNVLKSFVVSCKEDRNFLYQEIRQKKRIPINIIEVSRMTPTERPISEQKINILKTKHGVQGYMDEVLAVEPMVLEALKSHSNVHRVIVGNKTTNEHIDRRKLLDYLSAPDASLNQQGPQSFVICVDAHTTYRKFTGTKSRYSGGISHRQDEIARAKMLAPGVTAAEKQKVKDELAELHERRNELVPKRQEAATAKNHLENQAQQDSAKVQAIKMRKEAFTKFQRKLAVAKEKMEAAQTEVDQFDDQKKKKDFAEQLMNRVAHSISAVESHAEQQAKMVEANVAIAGVLANKSYLAVVEREAQLAVIERKRESEGLESEVRRIQQEFQTTKQQLGAKKQEAETNAPLSDANGEPTPLKDKLEALGVETLRAAEVELEAAEEKANSMDANPDVIRRYHQIKRDIAELQAQLDELVDNKKSKADSIKNKRVRWETALDTHIAEINSLFTVYMSEMGCTGEVVLAKGQAIDGEQTGNFKDWGIEIHVSFREGCPPSVLSAERHSGGERSVSTIMFLMALQDLMVAPFRCVDEINQGLDERNERLVFKRIVNNSCRPTKGGPTGHSGQYFLITPKLLPNLHDMENDGVTILFVFNGPYNFSHPREWNIAELLGRSKRQIEGDEADTENSGNVAAQPQRKKGRKLKD